MMLALSLFPAGVLQVWDVLQNGYWHARSHEFIASKHSLVIEWMRMPGDVVFIVFGAVPLLIATLKAYFRSEEHTSELQSLMRISYAVFCLKKKKETTHTLVCT